MRIDPAQVLRLKQELEDVRDDARDFVRYESSTLRLRPMGADPVSHDAADLVGQNADTAVACMKAYVEQLTSVIDSLDLAVRQYVLTDADAIRTA